MLLRLLLLLLVLPSLAPAQDEPYEDTQDDQRRRGTLTPDDLTEADLFQAVLVVPLSGETRDAVGVGSLLESFLRSSLSDNDRFEIVGLEECPRVDEVEAELYYDGCPEGNELGCQFIIGEVAKVDRVVSGRVSIREDGNYRVVVTILNVREVELEYTYAVDLSAGEEEILPATVRLALDRLRREELLAPYRDAQEEEEELARAMEEAASEEERRIVARMDAELDVEEIELLEEQRRLAREPRMTEADLEEQKSYEGALLEWEQMGITERQYLAWRNSNLEFDKFRWRWAGHRLQLLGSVWGGVVTGSTGLRYYGKFLLTPDLSSTEDFYSWQTAESGTSVTFGLSVGVGILRNLDFEASGWWATSPLWIRLATGNTIEAADGSGNIPDPENRPPGDWTRQTKSLWGGDFMFRFFILTMPVVRPTIGAGFGLASYINLYNGNCEYIVCEGGTDTSVAEGEDGIPSGFWTFRRLVDYGPVLEPGVQVDFNKHLGIFLRVPVFIGLNPARQQQSREPPLNTIVSFDQMPDPPFGTVRVVVGVQGRILGMPLKTKQTSLVDDTLEDLE
jgi:hypothetical protein